MQSRTERKLRVVLLGALATACLGCPNPNTYTTPRTAGSGKFTHSIAVEAWGFSVPTSNSAGTTTTLTATLPTLPTYTLRVGVGDRFEIGGRIANLSSLGADVKWNFLRSGFLDAAIDPGGQIFSIGTTTTTDSSGNTTSAGVSVIYLHLPLLIGLNLARSVTLVLAPGVTWGIASATTSSTADGQDQASGTTGAIGRMGVAFDLRMSPTFALHPEVTLLRTFDSNAVTLYTIGLGFNFGALPSYDDIGGGAESAPPPPPPGYYPPPPAYQPPPAGAPPPPPSPYQPPPT